jgi:hypothetical protein
MDGGPQVVYYYCLVKTKREGKADSTPVPVACENDGVVVLL